MLSPHFITALCAAALLAALHLPAHAQTEPSVIEVISIAEQEIEVVNEDGKKEIKRIPVDKALPGDEIVYTTTFKNLLDKPAANITLTNPVPNDSLYQGGSAGGANTVITFSVDGGKQYAAPEKLTIKTEQGKTRAALPADYTHLRWTYKGELGAGKSGDVSFRAVIK